MFKNIINDKSLWLSKCLRVRSYDFSDSYGDIEEISNILMNEVNLDEDDIDLYEGEGLIGWVM